MRRLAVGLAKSPVHSYTPTARTTCSVLATLCVCAMATEATMVAVPKMTRRKRALISLLTRLDAICEAKSYEGALSKGERVKDGRIVIGYTPIMGAPPLLDVRDLSIA